MRKSSSEGVRARRYRRLQLVRGLGIASVIAVLFAVGASLLIFRSKPERITGTNWASTRSFSGTYSTAELKAAYKASHSAYMHYVKREQLVVDHTKIAKSFDNVRSEAELVGVLNDLIRMSEDPHARLWTQSENDHFFALMTGKEIGVELRFRLDWQNNRWIVDYCPPESSANRAGIQVGDELISVGSDSIHVFGQGWQAGQKIEAALNNGLLGSSVDVVVRRGEEFISGSVERVITGALPTVTFNQPWNPINGSQMNNALVVRVVSLYHPNVVSALETQLVNLDKLGIKGIVLDLTQGFGGDPEAGIRLAAMFMEKGVICHRVTVTESGALEMHKWEVKDGKVHLTTQGPFPVDADGNISKTPGNPEKTEVIEGWSCGLYKGQVVISVDQFTRGAGEIIVGAVKQDKTRCAVVGSMWTGGRGTGQSHYSIGVGYVLRLSTSFYLQPDGTALEGKGIEPDVGANPNFDPTSFATFVLADRLQVIPAPELPPEPVKNEVVPTGPEVPSAPPVK